jgi:hypothetical protein
MFDSCSKEVKDFYLDEDIEDIKYALINSNHPDIADQLAEFRDIYNVSNGETRIVVIDRLSWPDELLIPNNDGELVNVMVLLNGIVSNLHIELVIE